MQKVDLLHFARLISQLILEDDPRGEIPQKKSLELHIAWLRARRVGAAVERPPCKGLLRGGSSTIDQRLRCFL